MKLFGDAPTRRLLNRLSRGDRHAWVELVVLSLLATQIVRLIWVAVTPVGPYGDWRGVPLDVPPLAERQALFTGFDPFFRGLEAAAAVAPQVATALNLTLFGITLNQATGGGSAIIAGADGIQNSYILGQEVEPGAKLVGLAFDQVSIDRGGTREVLYIDQDRAKAAAEVSRTQNAAPASPAQLAPSAPASPFATPAPPAPAPPPPPPGGGNVSPAALRSGVGFSPRQAGGQVTGVTVRPQGDGQVFTRAGLRSGDVIRSVNGQAIRSAADLARLQGQLAPGARLSLEVERGAGTTNVALTLGAQ